jgi:hypothetical protein
MRVIPNMLIASIMAFSFQYNYKDLYQLKCERQSDNAFWVTYNEPGSKKTVVQYYANATLLLAESIEPCQLNINKRSVRRYLDKKLKETLAKDSTVDFWTDNSEKEE